MDLLGTVLTIVAVAAFWLGLWGAAVLFAPDTRDGRDWRLRENLRARPARRCD